MAESFVPGAVHDTVRLAFPTVRLGVLGASGGCGAGIALPESDHALSPTLLVAITCTWYLVPLVRLPISAVVPSPLWLWDCQLPQLEVEAQVFGVAVQARYCTS